MAPYSIFLSGALHLKKVKLICILMSQISILPLINQQDFWLPGVFYTGKELRLGALS